MSGIEPDPDLPGDETFRPAPPIVEHVVRTCPQCPAEGRCPACGGGPVIAMAMSIEPEAQAAIHHNRLRYAELQLLRMGQPNRYAKTRYRHR